MPDDLAELTANFARFCEMADALLERERAGRMIERARRDVNRWLEETESISVLERSRVRK
jgi:hypothetical protein